MNCWFIFASHSPPFPPWWWGSWKSREQKSLEIRESVKMTQETIENYLICAMVKSRYIADGHPTFNRNPYNGYINLYYWVDDHPLLYGNNGSLDPGTYQYLRTFQQTPVSHTPNPQPTVYVSEFLSFGGERGCLGYAKQGYVGAPLDNKVGTCHIQKSSPFHI